VAAICNAINGAFINWA